jgi:hypothetical protein
LGHARREKLQRIDWPESMREQDRKEEKVKKEKEELLQWQMKQTKTKK